MAVSVDMSVYVSVAVAVTVTVERVGALALVVHTFSHEVIQVVPTFRHETASGSRSVIQTSHQSINQSINQSMNESVTCARG